MGAPDTGDGLEAGCWFVAEGLGAKGGAIADAGSASVGALGRCLRRGLGLGRGAEATTGGDDAAGPEAMWIKVEDDGRLIAEGCGVGSFVEWAGNMAAGTGMGDNLAGEGGTGTAKGFDVFG